VQVGQARADVRPLGQALGQVLDAQRLGRREQQGLDAALGEERVEGHAAERTKIVVIPDERQREDPGPA
jgi:hypothetical protein